MKNNLMRTSGIALTLLAAGLVFFVARHFFRAQPGETSRTPVAVNSTTANTAPKGATPPLQVTHQKTRPPFLTVAVADTHASPPSQSQKSLLSNGDFSKANKSSKWPADWPHAKGVTWKKGGKSHYLRLHAAKPGQTILLYRQITLPTPLPPVLEISLRVRYKDIVPGDANWHDGRIIMHFKDKAGTQLSPDPAAPYFDGSSGGWVDKKFFINVPKHSHFLEVMPCLFQAAKGTLDIARCQVFAATADKLPDGPRAQAQPMAVPIGPASPPPELYVVGNRLRTAQHLAVWLQGVNVPSMEWNPQGEKVLRSIREALDVWKANVIRLPVNQDSWFGKQPGQNGDGRRYRALVAQAVATVAARHDYIVLDLHWSDAGVWGKNVGQKKMPDVHSVIFWKSVARVYSNNPCVLFDLYNEPHSVSWFVWKNGGMVTERVNNKPITYQSPGMQGLLNAVRSTGAENVVVAGGLDWAYDLTGVAHGYALTESSGNGVMYAAHIYPWKTDWKKNVGQAARLYPILVGEVGCDAPGHQIISANGVPQRNPYRWAPEVLAYIQKHKLNWTAWCMHPHCSPDLVENWQFAPTPWWGAFVRAALAGARFTMSARGTR